MTWLAGLIGLPMIASPLFYIAEQNHAHLPKVMRIRWLALVVLMVMWLVLGFMVHEIGTEHSLTLTTGTINLHIDGVGLLMSLLIVTLATCTVIFSGSYIDDARSEGKYYALVLLLTGSMIGLMCAGDLFNLWVWFELVAISSYLLVAFQVDRQDSLIACVKYFVQISGASALVLFAIGLVFVYTGTLDLTTITHSEKSPLLVMAGAMFIMGFGVKTALAPNYTWLSDVYAEAPAPISALFSGVVTVTALITLIRVLAIVSWSPEQWGSVLMVFGAANILIGNLAAIVQTRVKRILAYSSISHIGFIALALGIGITTQSDSAMQSGLLHLFIHGLMKALAFLVVGVLTYHWQVQSGGERLFTVGDLKGTARVYPGMVVALTLAILSLAGVPPLAGFYSKFMILSSGIDSNTDIILILTIFAGVNTLFALGYYLPIINALFQPNSTLKEKFAPDIPLRMRLPVYIISALIVIFGIAPQMLEGLTRTAGSALLDLFTS